MMSLSTRLIAWLLLFWGTGLFASSAFAQGSGRFALPRLEGAVRLDGPSEEPAWEAIAPLPLTMTLPTFGGTPTERTEIRVAYDADHLYVAGRFYDTDPSGIRVNSLYRDRESGDDMFVVLLDTYNDNENALWFATTPAGVRIDQAIANDGESSSNVNTSWNTFWEVATVVNDAGWFAEMRIPFSSLRFQNDAGEVVMGLTVARFIARKNEQVTFPALPPKWPLRKPSAAQDVVLERVEEHNPLYLTPYSLGGLGQSARLNGAGTAFESDTDLTREVGFDLKYNLTSNLALDVTVNTDFAQAEADDQQVNLTRFSLFFPEKRPFFQERSGIFDFTLDRGGRLFHSRRIGLDDEGGAVRILGGVRTVGRVGAWDLGLIGVCPTYSIRFQL